MLLSWDCLCYNWRLDYYNQSIYQPTYNGNYKRDNIRSADSYQIISKYSRKVITYLFVRTPAWLWRTPSWTPTPRWPRRGAPRRRGAGQLRPPSRSRSRRRAWRSAVASTRLAQSLSHHLDLTYWHYYCCRGQSSPESEVSLRYRGHDCDKTL